MTKPIVCVFSIDDAYAQHFAVAVASLLANNPGRRISAHIIHHGVRPTNLAMLRGFLATKPALEFQFHAFDPSRYDFRVSRDITVASFFRFFLPDILPADVDRAIYLDSDLVVLGDIGPLWEADLKGAAIGAAADPLANKPWYLWNYGQTKPTTNAQLGLPDDHAYFNAGVLVVDLKAWRERNVKERLIDYAQRNHEVMLYHDQDALNAVLHDDVAYLGYEWNFQAKTCKDDAERINVPPAELRRLAARPQIVHFAGSDKPWKYRRKVPYEREYFRYLRATPWRGYVQPDLNLKGFMGRYFSPARDALRQAYRKSLKPKTVEA